jgi:hypothetical protein
MTGEDFILEWGEIRCTTRVQLGHERIKTIPFRLGLYEIRITGLRWLLSSSHEDLMTSICPTAGSGITFWVKIAHVS